MVNAAERIFVFLDFDGTLAPIVNDPSAAAIPAETRASLVSLIQKPRFFVALISGRALPDLQRRVDMEGLTYAANHGLVISGPGLDFVEKSSAGRASALHDLSRDLEVRLSLIPRVRVEYNGLTV